MQPPNKEQIHSVREALIWASSCLQQAGFADHQFEAELLLRHVLRMDRTQFIMSMTEPIDRKQVEQLEVLCQRRLTHEPLQYILGGQEFYGRLFAVQSGVLIPRPETEILVEQVMRQAALLWPVRDKLQVADIGTGSGAISVTLACECPEWSIHAVDLSPEAIRIARGNAQTWEAEERITFHQGDLVQPLLDKQIRLDILVSNPPYIPSAEIQGLDREVRQYEPQLALDGGADGLDCYRQICAALPDLLQPTALVAFEVGMGQSSQVAELLQASGCVSETLVINDLAGIDRVVLGWRKNIS